MDDEASLTRGLGQVLAKDREGLGLGLRVEGLREPPERAVTRAMTFGKHSVHPEPSTNGIALSIRNIRAPSNLLTKTLTNTAQCDTVMGIGTPIDRLVGPESTR